MAQSQDTTAEDSDVRPNARYDAVFGTNYAGLDDDSDRMEELRESTRAEAAALREVEEGLPGPRPPEDRPDRPALSWDDISVAEDAQTLASICSYFSGVSAGEDKSEIHRKLRTVDVEVYANVFLVVRGILDDGREVSP